MQVRRALISLYDKEGVLPFARGLVEMGVEIISTGGTFRHLQEGGIPVTSISDVTGAPEILGGRVKTLHPKVHGGILARRDREEDRHDLAEQQITPIDLVAVNLYPFEETARRTDVTEADVLEMIDIGGPTMLRAAAKNYPHVIVAVRSTHFEEILSRLKEGTLDEAFRRRLAVQAFAHTAAYDRAICAYFDRLEALS